MPDPAHFIDITLPLSERLPVWPGDAPVRIERTSGAANVSQLHLTSHAGTHLDAPAHFLSGSATVEQLPLDVLIGPAYVAAITGTKVITAQTLDAAKIPTGVARLLLRTSAPPSVPASKRRPEPVILDRRQPGHLQPAPFNKDYVSLDATAAHWLLARQVRLIGIDSPSVDPFTSGDFAVHHLLLANQVIIVENLALEAAPAGHYRLICLPLRYEGGDGAPVRAVLERLQIT